MSKKDVAWVWVPLRGFAPPCVFSLPCPSCLRVGGVFSSAVLVVGGFSLSAALVGCRVVWSPLGAFARSFSLEVSMSVLSSVAVVPGSALAGGVPSSFALRVGSAPVPSSAFAPALPGAVLLGSPVAVSLRSGVGVSVPWSCPVSGLSGSVRCGGWGFPSPAAASAFVAALEAAAFASASSGAVFFLGGAPGGPRGEVLAGWFCAVSSEPFGSASPASASAPSLDAFGR